MPSIQVEAYLNQSIAKNLTSLKQSNEKYNILDLEQEYLLHSNKSSSSE